MTPEQFLDTTAACAILTQARTALRNEGIDYGGHIWRRNSAAIAYLERVTRRLRTAPVQEKESKRG